MKQKQPEPQQQPLKQVDNIQDNRTAATTPGGTPPSGSSPVRSPVTRSEGKTAVAFGRTTKVTQQQKSPSKLHARRYSLENDTVSITKAKYCMKAR